VNNAAEILEEGTGAPQATPHRSNAFFKARNQALRSLKTAALLGEQVVIQSPPSM